MTFAIGPFGTQPFSSSGQEIRVCFDITTSLDASFQYKIYVATSQFATLPTDALVSQPFRGVLENYSFQRSILGSTIGKFTTGGGSLVISNIDAFYDFLPLYYTIDARPITLHITRSDGSYDGAFPFAKVTSTGWDIDVTDVNITLRDYGYKLDVPMQPNLYGGTGGADGGTNLAGQRKPMAFGPAHNVPAIALSVSSLLIYQVNDGSVQDIVAVYDRGIPLTKGSDYASYTLLAAAVVPAGYFATCFTEGYFRLGSTPTGTVTSDVQGDNSDGYLTTTADIVRWAIRNRTELVDPDDLDVQSFTNVNALQPAPIDYWIGPNDSLTVADFISNIMGGIGGWGGHRRDGTFEVKIFLFPSGSPVARFTRNDMLGGDIKRDQLPESYRPPPWRYRVPYQISWEVQTDLAAGVSDDHRAFVSQPYRLAESSNAAIKVDHPFAQDRDPIQAYFSNQSDAAAEALRLINLFKASAKIYTAQLPRRALRRNLGDVIEITHARFDLSQGKLMTVVEIDENIAFGNDQLDTVTVKAYG